MLMEQITFWQKQFLSVTGKLVGLGSDWASNMTGHKSGLTALLKQEGGSEIITLHYNLITLKVPVIIVNSMK